MERELRYSTIVSDNNEMIVEGYAIVFDQRTLLYEVDGVKYYEVIDRGALNNTDLKDICLKYNHSDNAKVLARTRNNTLEVTVDNKGLFIRGKLADTTDGQDLYKLVKRGDLDKMSFAFTVDNDDFDRSSKTRTIRSIKKVFEVSVVDIPAYEGTSIVAKRCKEEMKKEVEIFIRKNLTDKICGQYNDSQEMYKNCSIQELRQERLEQLEKQIKKIELDKLNLRNNNGNLPYYFKTKTISVDEENKIHREYEELLKEYRTSPSINRFRKGDFLSVQEIRKQYNELMPDGFEVIESLSNLKGVGKMENRSFTQDLLEKRSALVSSNILIPKLYHEVIQPKFNDVSGILELVQHMPMDKGNGLKVPYVKSTSVGNITDEGAEYGETPTEFGSVDIDAVKITAYMEYSEEVEKLPQAQYEAYIIAELSKILERKLVQQIAKGNGLKQFKGLYDLTVADNSSDLEVSVIDSTTLNKIVYNHNIEAEEVEANNILFLNKKDLGAFANVLIDGKPVYNISFSDNGMTGHINGTKFCICNSLNSLSEATTGSYSMVYMDPTKYMVAMFGSIDLKKDYSTGFRNGIIGVKASMFAGGSLVSPFGISRIKKV